MTFEEAYNISAHGDWKECWEALSDTSYCPGGYDWKRWCEKTRQSIGRDDIILNVFFWQADAKRPYFRMRGKPVTEEQAREIILRTRCLSFDEEEPMNIRSINLVNRWLGGVDSPHGWCHPDGRIGQDSALNKFPDSKELLLEFFALACEFPFLDLVMAITDFNETPYYYFRNDELVYDSSVDWRSGIDIGVQLKDGQFRMLEKEEVLALYYEYDRKYGIAPEENLKPERNVYGCDHYSFHENIKKLRRFGYLKEYSK